MKYLILALGVAFLTIFAICNDKNNSNETVKNNKQKLSPSDFNFNPGGLDSFTIAELKRAIYNAHQEYGTSEKIVFVHRYTQSAKGAVDLVKGKEFFTRVSLSKGGDTLYVFSMGYESTNSPKKSLYDVVLDELVDYKVNKPSKR
jgi:hypothetical protein